MIERQETSFWKPIFTAACIIGGVAVATDFIFNHLIGISQTGFLASFIGSIPFITLVIMQILHREHELGGRMSYGQAFSFGFLSMAMAGILRATYIAILYTTKPGLWESFIRQVETSYHDIGISNQLIQQYITPMYDGVSLPILIISFSFSFIVQAVFSALIASLISMRRKPRTFNDNMNEIK